MTQYSDLDLPLLFSKEILDVDSACPTGSAIFVNSLAEYASGVQANAVQKHSGERGIKNDGSEDDFGIVIVLPGMSIAKAQSMCGTFMCFVSDTAELEVLLQSLKDCSKP